MLSIYLDESGNTGTNYFDPVQPFYVLSCSLIQSPKAEAILDKHFEAFFLEGTTDLKFKNLCSSARGRAALKSFYEELKALDAKGVSFAVFKPFAVVAKFLDWVIEPILPKGGVDIYKSGVAKGLAELLFYFGPVTYGEDQWNKLLRLFVAWAKGQEVSGGDLLTHIFELKIDLAEDDPRLSVANDVDLLIKLVLKNGSLPDPPDSGLADMDISFTAVFSIINMLTPMQIGRFRIIHDNSNIMEAQAGVWYELKDPEKFRKYTSVLGHPLEQFDFDELVFGDHTSNRALFVPDLLAGANRLTLGLRLDPSSVSENQRNFAESLIHELGFPWVSGGVIPDPPVPKG